ncbi:MAG: protein-L-isoaspartate(D-aspartate) O-methyltransferase [Candidatus Promineofilum sp.]|nr:protein-L-isoaspartate(D-aspartate) O-methyltransferase [Promineifilum sp.]MCW5863409.1 protein-L-isoaspartate(D-aspartate) O-methyltransferase [Anaerolineae bacterium]
MDEDARFAAARERMVADQIAGRGISDAAVLRAMRLVPRQHFVPESERPYAYDDTPLPIPAHQTISQPYVVAYMIAALGLGPDDRVLEVGAGSGYAAAVLSRIVGEVYTVERHPELVDYARARLAALGYDNVHVHQGDGTRGWPEHAPYDGIIVAAGGPAVPESLRAQMAVGGRLVMPVGRSRQQQHLVRVTRRAEGGMREEKLAPVAFVPLIGDEGW